MRHPRKRGKSCARNGPQIALCTLSGLHPQKNTIAILLASRMKRDRRNAPRVSSNDQSEPQYNPVHNQPWFVLVHHLVLRSSACSPPPPTILYPRWSKNRLLYPIWSPPQNNTNTIRKLRASRMERDRTNAPRISSNAQSESQYNQVQQNMVRISVSLRPLTEHKYEARQPEGTKDLRSFCPTLPQYLHTFLSFSFGTLSTSLSLALSSALASAESNLARCASTSAMAPPSAASLAALAALDP